MGKLELVLRGLRTHISPLLRRYFCFRLTLGDENEVIPQATYVLAAFCLGTIDKIRICKVADKDGDLWSHAMLGFEPGMRISF